MRKIIVLGTLVVAMFVSVTARAQAPVAAAACQDPAAKQIAVGMKVVAPWKGDNWWVAKVDKIDGTIVAVTFSDGEKGARPLSQLVPHPEVLYAPGTVPCLKVGDKVVSTWKGDSWWTGTLTAVNGTMADIAYSDGEKGKHLLNQMVKAPR